MQSTQHLDDNLLEKKNGNPNLVLIVFAILVLLANITTSYFITLNQEVMSAITSKLKNDVVDHILFVFSQCLLLPLSMVALFQISKKYRNMRSRTKIFFWTSFVVLVSQIGIILPIIVTR